MEEEDNKDLQHRLKSDQSNFQPYCLQTSYNTNFKGNID
jgi:hypothetical protein